MTRFVCDYLLSVQNIVTQGDQESLPDQLLSYTGFPIKDARLLKYLKSLFRLLNRHCHRRVYQNFFLI